MLSQNILTKKNRVETISNSVGDTLLVFTLKDSKIILKDLLDKKITDKLLVEYQNKDSINTKIVEVQNKQISNLKLINLTQETKLNNYGKIVDNKNKEINVLNELVKTQKKEISKQKFLKKIGFIGAIILPITVLLTVK